MNSQVCNSVDPQNGQPLCPCAMKTVKVVDGRYVQVIDLGEAKSEGVGKWPSTFTDTKTFLAE